MSNSTNTKKRSYACIDEQKTNILNTEITTSQASLRYSTSIQIPTKGHIPSKTADLINLNENGLSAESISSDDSSDNSDSSVELRSKIQRRSLFNPDLAQIKFLCEYDESGRLTVPYSDDEPQPPSKLLSRYTVNAKNVRREREKIATVYRNWLTNPSSVTNVFDRFLAKSIFHENDEIDRLFDDGRMAQIISRGLVLMKLYHS